MSTLALIILAVHDLERSLAFYRQVFDWRQTVDAPGYAEFELPSGLRVGLYSREGFARNLGQTAWPVPPAELTSTEIYFLDNDPTNLILRLRKAGARELSPLALRDWGDEAAYYADPDGNIIVAARTASS